MIQDCRTYSTHKTDPNETYILTLRDGEVQAVEQLCAHITAGSAKQQTGNMVLYTTAIKCMNEPKNSNNKTIIYPREYTVEEIMHSCWKYRTVPWNTLYYWRQTATTPAHTDDSGCRHNPRNP
jgi:hypothetical protein